MGLLDEGGHVLAGELALGDGEGDGHAAQGRGVLDAEAAARRVAGGEQARDGAEGLAGEHLAVLVDGYARGVAEHAAQGLLAGIGVVGRLVHREHERLLLAEILVEAGGAQLVVALDGRHEVVQGLALVAQILAQGLVVVGGVHDRVGIGAGAFWAARDGRLQDGGQAVHAAVGVVDAHMAGGLGLDQRLIVAVEDVGDLARRLQGAGVGRPFHEAEALVAIALAIGVDPQRRSRPQRVCGAVAGIVVVAAHGGLVGVVLARLWPGFSLATIYRVLLPVAAAIFIVLSSFPVGTMSFSLGFLVSHSVMATVALLALASLAAVARAGEFSPVVVGAALCAMTSVAVLVGANLAQLVPQDDTMGAVLLVCAMAYFVYVLISPLADYYRMFRETDGTGNRGENASCELARPLDYDRVCRALANERNLSAREREILPYIARGHRPAYVADLLCISEHTVRTHLRNMYRKLGINSREELIQLVEETATS